MVKELTKQYIPTCQGWVTGQGIKIAREILRNSLFGTGINISKFIGDVIRENRTARGIIHALECLLGINCLRNHPGGVVVHRQEWVGIALG